MSILPEYEVKYLESDKEQLHRVGLLLYEEFMNNKMSEKKHNLIFVDKLDDQMELHQYLDKIQEFKWSIINNKISNESTSIIWQRSI